MKNRRVERRERERRKRVLTGKAKRRRKKGHAAEKKNIGREWGVQVKDQLGRAMRQIKKRPFKGTTVLEDLGKGR